MCPWLFGRVLVWRCSATLRASWTCGLFAVACGGRTGVSPGLALEQPAPTQSAAPQPSAKPPGRVPEPEPDPVETCRAGMCPDDGDACNGVELCDPSTNTCVRTEAPECDDGLVCNGVETCDPVRGCVSGEPVECEAPGETCDENTGRCRCEPPFLLPDCRVKMALFAHLGTVRGLAEEPGFLWVTTSTGLWVLSYAGTPERPDDDAWWHFDELIDASDGGRVVIDDQRRKWFGGNYDRPLVRLDDGGTVLGTKDDAWQFYRAPDAFSPKALAVDASDGVWLARYGETLVFSNGGTPDDRTDDAWTKVSQLGAPESLSTLPSVDVIVRGPRDTVWLGSSTGKLFAYDPAERAFTDLTDTRWPHIGQLAWAGDTLWMAGPMGTDPDATLVAVPVKGVPSSVSRAVAPSYPSPHAVAVLAADEGNRAWLSDESSNFSCVDGSTGNTVSWDVHAAVTAILPRSATDLWFGVDSVYHVDHGGSCSPQSATIAELHPEQALQSEARDVAIEGQGVWLATAGGVDYLDTRGTPLDRNDDRWAHFDKNDVVGLEDLQGALVGPDGIKYFWGQTGVFALDDGGTPLDKADDAWVGHETSPLWVSGVLDHDGRLLIVARNFGETAGTPQIVVFDPAGTPRDGSDDVVTTLDSGLPGFGRNMTIDARGELWLGTETENEGGNLYHWDRSGTPLQGDDDVWTAMREEDGRVWKLEADPTGGIWGTVADGVFQFFDNGTPSDVGDDYWHLYPELGSAMDIGPNGIGWFRMPGGVGILDVGGTPRDPRDDVASVLLSPDALKFHSNLYTNGVIDDGGRFWVVDGYVQVFELAE